MKVCVPVMESKGLESPLSGHFGSAPFFVIVDTESLECRAVENANAHHAHGMCQPLAALVGNPVDGVVVGGIGAGALNKLNAAGIAVYRGVGRTVGEVIGAFKAGTLQKIAPGGTCAGHGHGHGCGH